MKVTYSITVEAFGKILVEYNIDGDPADLVVGLELDDLDREHVRFALNRLETQQLARALSDVLHG